MTLLEAPKGKYKVIKVLGGRNATARLSALGILPNVQIKKLKSGSSQPSLIEIDNRGTLVIGRGLSAKIEVEKYD